MNKKIIRSLMVLAGFCSFAAVHANILIPSALIWGGLYNVFAWYLILFGFGAELVCMRFLVRKAGWTELFGVTAAMNLGSTIIGILAFIVFDFMFWFIVNSVTCFLRSLAYYQLCVSIIYGVLFFIMILALNVLIEGIIGIWFFPHLDRKQLLFWLFAANFLTLLIGVGGLGYEMITGQIQDVTRNRLYTAMEQEDIRKSSKSL